MPGRSSEMPACARDAASGARLTARERERRWTQGVGHVERETFDAFLQLPVEQKRLIRETIMLFAKANASGPAPGERAAVKPAGR